MNVTNFQEVAERTLHTNLRQIGRCVRLLNLDQLWWRANDHCNSIGNLLLHLNGNVRQWIVEGLGGIAYDRDRPAEFAERRHIPGDALLSCLNETMTAAVEMIRTMDAAALERTYEIQTRRVSGMEAIFHVVEHFSFHTGQIIHTTKELLDVDLSLYGPQGQPLSPPNQHGQNP